VRYPPKGEVAGLKNVWVAVDPELPFEIDPMNGRTAGESGLRLIPVASVAVIDRSPDIRFAKWPRCWGLAFLLRANGFCSTFVGRRRENGVKHSLERCLIQAFRLSGQTVREQRSITRSSLPFAEGRSFDPATVGFSL
jgi:hypothetical protein